MVSLRRLMNWAPWTLGQLNDPSPMQLMRYAPRQFDLPSLATT